MGSDKALLPVAGRPMILRAVETLGGVLAEVVVVSVPGRDYAVPARSTIYDLKPGRGPLAGLHAALIHAGGRPVFALACDLPFVSRGLVEYVMNESRRENRQQRPTGGAGPWARVPRWRNRLQPLCALYDGACLPVVEECLERGRLAMRDLLRRIAVVPVPITAELPFYRPDLLLNVNRPASLAESAGPEAVPERLP